MRLWSPQVWVSCGGALSSGKNNLNRFQAHKGQRFSLLHLLTTKDILLPTISNYPFNKISAICCFPLSGYYTHSCYFYLQLTTTVLYSYSCPRLEMRGNRRYMVWEYYYTSYVVLAGLHPGGRTLMFCKSLICYYAWAVK